MGEDVFIDTIFWAFLCGVGIFVVNSIICWMIGILKNKKLGEEMLFSIIISAMGLSILPLGLLWLVADALGYYPYAITVLVAYYGMAIFIGHELHKFWENDDGFFKLYDNITEALLSNLLGFCDSLFFRVGNVFGIFPNIG